MENIQKRKTILTAFLVLLLCLQMLLPFATVIRAETVEYSGVLEDLQKDANFDASAYPSVADDYSMQVIQIAESVNDTLILYVYQPSAYTKKLVASSVRLSQTRESADCDDYDLTLLDSEGIFQKYRVEGVTVSESSVRSYFIVCLHRPFDKNIDEKPTDDNTIVAKAVPIEQIWTATTTESGVTYKAEYSEDTIAVTAEHFGYISYDKGQFFYSSKVDSHYLAFSTNKPIDAIKEARISYEGICHNENSAINKKDDEAISGTVVLNEGQVFQINNFNFFSDEYTYTRIQTASAFLKCEGDEKLEESTIKAVSGKQWVLRFLETERSYNAYDPYINIYSRLTAVTLFRLKYEYRGQIYDVGVVSDIAHGDDKADGTGNSAKDWGEWFEKIMMMLGFIILLVFLWPLIIPLLSLFFSMLWTAAKTLLRCAWKLLTLPIRIITKPFRE